MNLKTLVLAAAAALGVSATQAAEYRIGLITPPPHQWTKTATAMAEDIKARTDGRVEILVFPSGQLGNEGQMLQQLQTGALDFAFLTLGEFSNRKPNFGIFLAPYIVEDVAGARELLKGETAQKVLAEVEDLGLVGFGYGMAGMRQIVMAGKVDSVDGLKGKKIRTIPLAPELDFWTGLGATPTPMPLPALYDAFANKQVDGMQIDFEGTWNTKYHDHAGTIIESNHMMFPMVAVASARKWATISDEDKAAITESIKTHLDELVGAYKEIDATYLASLKTTEVPVITADRAFFGPAVDAWYEVWRQKAPLLSELEAEAAKLQ